MPGPRRRGQDAADLFAGAGGRVGGGGAVLEIAEDVLRLGEFGQALLDMREMLVSIGRLLAW